MGLWAGLSLASRGTVKPCSSYVAESDNKPGGVRELRAYPISPTGAVLETHIVPAGAPLNCAFGDPGLASLYVSTSEGHLFRVRTGK